MQIKARDDREAAGIPRGDVDDDIPF